MNIIETLATEFGLKIEQVEKTVELIDEGNTIPFIARYRKEVTGSLNDEQLRNLHERLTYLRNLEEKKEQVIATIEEQGKMTDELKAKILAAETLVVVEDLYRPYRPKRKTRASVAKEKGLEPLAEFILKQDTDKSLLEEAANYINEEKEVKDAKEALQGAADIIAESISDEADYRIYIRDITTQEGTLTSTAKDEKEQSVYEMYYAYEEPVKKMPPHRILAINRAEKEMLEISPEDKHQIKKFFKHVRLAQSLEVPVKKPLDMMNLFELISMGLKELKMIPVLLNYSNIDLGSLAKKFKHPLLKQMLVDYLPKEYLAYILITAYGSIASGGGGVPIGGSLNAALRMANRYKDEGGTLVCSKPIAKINIENNITTGVTFEDGSVENADFVICTTDTFHAFEKLIPNKYMPKALQKCYNNREAYPLGSSFHVAFSYDGTTDIIKGRTFFNCDEITIANKKITRTNIKNYSFEKTSVPEGKSLLQVKILEREEEYEYWKKLYEENKEQYNKEKMEAAKSIQKTIEARYPFTKGKLKIIDTWTPFTYTRFVNAYYGVFMTFMTTVKSQGIMNLKGIIKGIKELKPGECALFSKN